MIEFIESHFFALHDNNLVIPVFLIYVVVNIYMFYLSIQDLWYREIEPKYILLSYPVLLVCGYLLFGISIDLLMGFLTVAVMFYFTQVYCSVKYDSEKVYIGAMDIIAAPIYTLWFGAGVLTYLVIFLLVLLMVDLPFVKDFFAKMTKVESEKDALPLIPCMHLTFILVTLFIMV